MCARNTFEAPSNVPSYTILEAVHRGMEFRTRNCESITVSQEEEHEATMSVHLREIFTYQIISHWQDRATDKQCQTAIIL